MLVRTLIHVVELGCTAGTKHLQHVHDGVKSRKNSLKGAVMYMYMIYMQLSLKTSFYKAPHTQINLALCKVAEFLAVASN